MEHIKYLPANLVKIMNCGFPRLDEISFLYLDMKRIASLLSVVLISYGTLDCTAQQSPLFSRPMLSLKDGKLIISYDILNSSISELYKIILEVQDSDGKTLDPRSVSGDIGVGVPGGSNKEIIWNLNTDRISMDHGIYVQIIGEEIIPPGEEADEHVITRMGAIGRSVLLPGWGLSKLNTGKPHWIKGIAGYGAITGSLVLNQRSQVNYQNYLDSGSESERKTLYDKSINQETVSVVMAYAAAGIWVADLVWTVIGTKGLSKKNQSGQAKGFSIGSGFEPALSAPMLSFRYSF